MNKRIRKKKGLSKIRAEECWSLDKTLAKYIYPRLVKFKEINEMSYPSELKSHEEWHSILDKIIFSFDIIANDKEVSMKNTNWFELTLEQDLKVQKGLDLFAKYFRNLWD